ncbi:selenocysteine-specific translation elongation factor [Paenibacillus xerothermodurans]|uniref:Selenocysteine-specific elongation factor n=1 Tax=Paenibacillus xerothermodurans TaxID=1977292 RepID=A0A2W1NE82_PAEXE|nr:selenocysteine-specific translation elongation factor [Paenibacillus xerothermodurans]PZE22234.1 selenocysteine-specific translation elongation factor [Paenibacillus xerothermodurans]
MKPHYFTIGMAGHIDHGKTSLTKALTNVDTDRLKEEKERKISIELGYAPFPLDEYKTSIVDVPGHEKFIRQMIAGVAGIDLVILVIAADEGVMPQTEEHIEILSFLGIEHGIIAVTKVDRVEQDFIELIEEDIKSTVKSTIFEHADIVFVDSITGTGLTNLRLTIKQNLSKLPQRNAIGAFRLPIDQVFTVQGQGTVVRGTVYEGTIETGDVLTVLPQNVSVKARKLHVHNQEKEVAVAGQRVAINLSGLTKEELKRGDVLVSSGEFPMSDTIDISLTTVHDLQFPVKQRAPIKFHSATSEVMGKIIFFDRKELHKSEEILCQIRLEEKIMIKRGDRFVIRRPSPVETIGGGWVIDPLGEKQKFGEKTIQKLERKKEGSPTERILDALHSLQLVTKKELLQFTSIPVETMGEALNVALTENSIVELDSDVFTSKAVYEDAKSQLFELVRKYHAVYPLRTGMNKAECMKALDKKIPARLTEIVIDKEVEEGILAKNKQYIAVFGFKPHFPDSWKNRLEHAFARLQDDELAVKPWNEYMTNEKVPEKLYPEVTHFLLQNQLAFPLDESHLIHRDVFVAQLKKLYEATSGQAFGVQEAKAGIAASRKNLILFLELLDQLKITQRTEEKRIWVKESCPVHFEDA